MDSPQTNSNDRDYARLMARHYRDLLSYIRTLHPYSDEAEDILQETAMNLYRHFSDYDASRPFLPWAFRFAAFEVMRFRRSKARSRLVFTDELLDIMSEERSDRSVQEALQQRRNHLVGCLDKLEASDKQLIHWRYESQHSIKQLAENLKVSVKRLYKRLERVRIILYRCVTQHQTLS